MQEKENTIHDHRSDYKLSLRKKNLDEILKSKRNNSKNILTKKEIDSIVFNVNSLPEIRLYQQSYEVCNAIDDRICYCFRGLEDNSTEFKYFCVSKLYELKSYFNTINLLFLSNTDIFELLRMCFDKNVMFEATSLIEELASFNSLLIINSILEIKISYELFELLKRDDDFIIRDNILSIFGFIFENKGNKACNELISKIGFENIYSFIKQALNNYFYFPLFSRGNLMFFITKFIDSFDNSEMLYFKNDFAVQLLATNLNILNYEFNEEFTFEIMKSAQFIINILEYIDMQFNDKNIFNQLKEEISNFYNDFSIACIKIIKNDQNKRITNLALLIVEKVTYNKPSLWENIVNIENFQEIMTNTITNNYQISNEKLPKINQKIIINTYCVCINMLLDYPSNINLQKIPEIIIYLINVIMQENYLSESHLNVMFRKLSNLFLNVGFKYLKSKILIESNFIILILNSLKNKSENKDILIDIVFYILNDESPYILNLKIKYFMKLNGLSDIIEYLISHDELKKGTLSKCQKICDILSEHN